MKKRITSAVVAVVMLLSLTTVAFADNNKNNGHNKDKKDKVKIEVQKDKDNDNDNEKKNDYNKKHNKGLLKDLKKVQLKITIATKQLTHWTAKKTAIEKLIVLNVNTTNTVTTVNRAKAELYKKQLIDLDAWKTTAIAVTGLSADQIAVINTVYNTEKAELTSRIEKAVRVELNKTEDLTNALAQANKKIAGYTEALVKLNAKLAEINAKIVVTPTPTVVPTVAPTVTPSVVPTVTP